MATALFAPVGFQILKLGCGLFGERGRGPDLAVRVRVRAAHGAAFVLEDLHVAVLTAFGSVVLGDTVGLRWQGGRGCGFGEGAAGVEVRGVDFGPLLYHWKDCGRWHVGQREVVVGREGNNVAFACGRLGAKETGREG